MAGVPLIYARCPNCDAQSDRRRRDPAARHLAIASAITAGTLWATVAVTRRSTQRSLNDTRIR